MLTPQSPVPLTHPARECHKVLCARTCRRKKVRQRGQQGDTGLPQGETETGATAQNRMSHEIKLPTPPSPQPPQDPDTCLNTGHLPGLRIPPQVNSQDTHVGATTPNGRCQRRPAAAQVSVGADSSVTLASLPFHCWNVLPLPCNSGPYTENSYLLFRSQLRRLPQLPQRVHQGFLFSFTIFFFPLSKQQSLSSFCP